jgi:hypothetical protein
MTDLIFTTTNYDMFDLHELNRKVYPNSKPFRELVDQIKKQGFRRGYPIEVFRNGSGKLKIISGHNRLMAAKKAGVPVKYVYAEKLYAPIDGEVGPGKWKSSEIFECHCNIGNPVYLEIKQFIEKTGISLHNACSMFYGNSAGSGNFMKDSSFKDGTFKIRDRGHAHLVGDVVVYLKNIGVDFASQNNMVRAISSVLQVDGFDVDRLKAKAKKFVEILEKQRNLDGYLDMLEAVYNRHVKKTEKIPLAFWAKEGAKARNVCGLDRGRS